VRLWDATAAGTGTGTGSSAMPVMIANKSMAVGRLFGVQFYSGTPFLLATGGSKGQVCTVQCMFSTNVISYSMQQCSAHAHTTTACCVVYIHVHWYCSSCYRCQRQLYSLVLLMPDVLIPVAALLLALLHMLSSCELELDVLLRLRLHQCSSAYVDCLE
jgi:hypothetical protein